jgi:hypothetical protein
MPFQITITADAARQLRSLTTRQQRMVEDAVFAKLIHEPRKTTRAIKRLRPNPYAEYELRVSNHRSYY